MFNNVPANGWPQLKDLEKLDAIASQIENMPTFTSDDKAFLEDLPAYPETDGTKMLTATTTSGNTSLSYEDIPEELPADPETDGTRILTATTSSGTTVKSWEAYQSMPNYSTTEQATGQKWIDGKDIYFKTYEIVALPNATTTRTPTGLTNIDKVIKIEGMAYGNSTHNPLPFVSTSAQYSIECWVDDNENIVLTSSANYSAYNGVVTLYYTKTT